jgi:hypothetical protein
MRAAATAARAFPAGGNLRKSWRRRWLPAVPHALAVLSLAFVRHGVVRCARSSAPCAAGGSDHGGVEYVRYAGRSAREREEQRKAARLSLDTSCHGGDEFDRLHRVISSRRGRAVASMGIEPQDLAALTGVANMQVCFFFGGGGAVMTAFQHFRSEFDVQEPRLTCDSFVPTDHARQASPRPWSCDSAAFLILFGTVVTLIRMQRRSQTSPLVSSMRWLLLRSNQGMATGARHLLW